VGQGVTTTTGTINLSSGGTLTTGRPIVGGNATSNFHFDGGTLVAGANLTNLLQNFTTADIDGNGGTINDGGFTVSLPQPLLDNGGGFLTKTGNGTLYLDGTNTYGNATVVTAGTLGGSGVVAGDLTLSNNAALAPGDFGIPGTLSVGGNLSFNGNVLVKLNTSLTQSNDLLAVTGLATNNGTGSVIVTNLGPTLAVGEQFYLFNQGVTNGNALTITGGNATWQNNLAVDGSITVQSLIGSTSTNAYLTSLTLSPAAILSPAFATNVFSYTASEPYGSTLAVTATDANANATNNLVIDGTSLGILPSGVPSTPAQALYANPATPNVVTVQVTAQDGLTMNTYTVNVMQIPSQSPRPQITRSVSAGTLTLSWPLAYNTYRLLEQTNNQSHGVSTNINDWGTLTGSTNTVAIPLPATGPTNEFYQLVYP